MTIIRRGKIVYYVKDEAVIVEAHGSQYSAYTVYPLQNRKPFYDFRRAIVNSEEHEYGTIIELIQLSSKYNLKGVATARPKEAEK